MVADECLHGSRLHTRAPRTDFPINATPRVMMIHINIVLVNHSLACLTLSSCLFAVKMYRIEFILRVINKVVSYHSSLLNVSPARILLLNEN